MNDLRAEYSDSGTHLDGRFDCTDCSPFRDTVWDKEDVFSLHSNVFGFSFEDLPEVNGDFGPCGSGNSTENPCMLRLGHSIAASSHGECLENGDPLTIVQKEATGL